VIVYSIEHHGAENNSRAQDLHAVVDNYPSDQEVYCYNGTQNVGH
jgi:hypothetical protein